MYQLRPYQDEARQAVLREWDEGHRKTLLVLPTGCHALGQKLLMSDGTTKAVEDIQVGDHLMGPDGKPRTILLRHEGKDKLYTIKPIKGEPFTVTGDHKLTLVKTNISKCPIYPSHQGGGLTDVTVNEWMEWSKYRKHIHKLLRCNCIRNFENRSADDLTVDPYFLGVLLGDGSLRHNINITTAEPEIECLIKKQAEKYGCTLRTEPAGKAKVWFFRNASVLKAELEALGLLRLGADQKHVPDIYKYSPIDTRLEVIAGLIDTDGCLSGGYDYITKSKQLADDLVFMCRSVGLAAYAKWCFKTCDDFVGSYYRISISGNCDIIPCRVLRRIAGPRKHKKNVLRTGFSVLEEGKGQYVGFTVDGDNRYLLDDFTITHNCGKTVVFASIIKETLYDRAETTLVLAHRGELLDQAAEKIHGMTGINCSLEKAESSCLEDPSPVAVGSVQTMARDSRLNRFPPDYFDNIIVDEAHHCLSDSYKRVLAHFPKAHVLGVTATPDRGDQKSLGEFFDSKAYEYTMAEAIREGYLCKIKAQMIPIELDIKSVGISSGDYAAGEIGHALEPYLEGIAQEMLRYCKGRKTVVFLPLIATSQKFCRMLNDVGLRAAEVNGDSADRSQILTDFERGKFDVLCNSMLLTEGWDCPSVDCIVVLRPTKVRSLYQQMVGRGMRLKPGKDHLLLLDFLWLTSRHDLCRPSALICKKAEVAQKMDQILSDGEALDIIEAESQAEKDVLAEREQALAKQLEEMRKRKRQLVDPMQYALSIAAEDLSDYVPSFAWEMAPPSEKQIKFLEGRGIYTDEIQNAGMASMLIDRLLRRQQEGLATPKQIRLLERYGFKHVGEWKFEAANSMITRIRMTGWSVPRGIIPSEYIPA